jgi:hypothetical protein
MSASAYDREFDDIERREAEGEITREQAQREAAIVRQAMREDAEEAGRDAYDRAMEEW